MKLRSTPNAKQPFICTNGRKKNKAVGLNSGRVSSFLRQMGIAGKKTTESINEG
ncbi:hypothetical protein CCACVL1_28593 [Corchorus capsularis]|uniref:Uncharacterized protein n=1 Tax=Corchorus capsularis TaxID=210143 RepID=A0A1R3G5Y9_COCAP|nr:hypothetical protein CCACVL1_28593 [Corchorus capsularis]